MGRYRRKREAKADAGRGSSRRSWRRGPSSSQLPRPWRPMCWPSAISRPPSDVTTTIFTACIGYLVSYAAKSATEKISRNRHGLDADGNPISGAGAGEYTTTTTSDKEAKG